MTDLSDPLATKHASQANRRFRRACRAWRNEQVSSEKRLAGGGRQSDVVGMNSATTRPCPAPTTAVEGCHYLLGQCLGWADFVACYTPREMCELFSAGQRTRLAPGETITTNGTQYTDMVAAARAAAA